MKSRNFKHMNMDIDIHEKNKALRIEILDRTSPNNDAQLIKIKI